MSLRTPLTSVFMDFVSKFCRHHAMVSLVNGAPCAPPLSGVNQTRTWNANLNKRLRIHMAYWKVRTLLNAGSQCISTRLQRFRDGYCLPIQSTPTQTRQTVQSSLPGERILLGVSLLTRMNGVVFVMSGLAYRSPDVLGTSFSIIHSPTFEQHFS